MKTVEAGQRIAVENVLFATDFSTCSDVALPYAASIARRFGATLHAAHVMPTLADALFISGEHWWAVADRENEETQKSIEQLEKQLEGLPHEVETPTGKISDALSKIIKEDKIDLLVLGTHGRAGVRKLITGSIAEEIFRRVACPVLSIGPNVLSHPKEEIEFHKILFATDFSENSMAALPYAVSLAEEDQGDLILLHVIEQSSAGILDLSRVVSSLTGRLQELIPRDAEPWCRAESLLEFSELFAPPSNRILEVAGERGADLIVLGVHPAYGKLGVVTHLASNTAEIVTEAACPVLTVGGQKAKSK
jgi:nucleotide-binding universal stress UspA family protein